MEFPLDVWVTTKLGRTGRVIQRAGTESWIQFGADGPVEWLFNADLRFATNEEIAEKNGTKISKRNADRNNLQELTVKEQD